MNLLELKKALNLRNYRTELNKIEHNDGEFFKYEIGISEDGWNWFWFNSYNENPESEINLFFNQRYSMNTGKTIKTFRCGWLFAKRIEKKLKFNILLNK